MQVRIFPPVTVKTKSYLQTNEEEKEHKRQEAEALEEIKSQILSKDIIGILEIKRHLELKEDEKTTDWVTFIITPDADNFNGQIQQKVCEILSENGHGVGGYYLSDMHIIGTGGSTLKLKGILEEEFA